VRTCKEIRAELPPLSNPYSSVFSLKRGIWGLPSLVRMRFGIWIGSACLAKIRAARSAIPEQHG